MRGATARSAAVGCGARRTDPRSGASALGASRTHRPRELTKGRLWGGSAPPNGSRLSCGRLARPRKVAGRSPCPARGTTLRFPVSFKRLLGGRLFVETAPAGLANSTIGKESAAMIGELLSVRPRDRETVHLPRLAQKAASAPVLGTPTPVIRHGSGSRPSLPRDDGGCSRVWPRASAPRRHPCPSWRLRVRSSSLDWPSVASGGRGARPPNGSRLSCGRLARPRKVAGRSPCPARGTTLRFP